jgi:hypothetical protein
MIMEKHESAALTSAYYLVTQLIAHLVKEGVITGEGFNLTLARSVDKLPEDVGRMVRELMVSINPTPQVEEQPPKPSHLQVVPREEDK